VLGTGASDLARWLIGSPVAAYCTVFALEALLFVGAAWLAARIGGPASAIPSSRPVAQPPEHPRSETAVALGQPR
jgi:BCD family chlorophyll transporter-like MFS transporter